MSLLLDLYSGDAGVRLRFPDDVMVARDEASQVVFVDETRGLQWHIHKNPARLCLDASTLAHLQRDIERAAHAVFQRTFTELASQQGWDLNHGPSTAGNPDFNPLVEAEVIEIPMRTLKVVHRMAFERGFEHVCGRLAIPLRDGVVELACHAIDTYTGMRESMLMLDLDDWDAPVSQDYFDSPEHDARFEGLALSRVRSALAWSLGTQSAFSVTGKPDKAEGSKVTLNAAACTIQRPPRYLPIPNSESHERPTSNALSRVALTAMELPVWVCEVTRFDGPPGGSMDIKDLCAMATSANTAAGPQGAATGQVDARAVPGTVGRVECRLEAPVDLDGLALVSRQRWLYHPAGHVWCVAMLVDSFVPEEEVTGDLNSVARSLQPV